MAKVETLVDDLNGKKATQTVHFSLDGDEHEIDLTDANAKRLREEIGRYAAKGRKVPRSRTTHSATRGQGNHRVPAGSGLAKRIRAWAESEGLEVSSRGRIPEDIREAYLRAHPA